MTDKAYPTDEQLDLIRNWDINAIGGWFEYVASIWHWDDRARIYKGRDSLGHRVMKAYFSTGGWSGNESIIQAMQENKNYLWMFTWWKMRRGGHYWFEWRTSYAKRQG